MGTTFVEQAMTSVPHDVVEQVALFCRLMGRRKETAVRDRLRRPRLTFVSDPHAKALVYRAPMGYGKSVEVALAADDASAAHEAVAYLSARSLPKLGLSSTDSLAAAILFQIAGEDQLRRAAGTASILPTLRETLLVASHPTIICLDDLGDDSGIRDFVTDLLCETSDLVRFVLAPSRAGGLPGLFLLPHVRTFGPQDLTFNETEASEAVKLRAPLIDADDCDVFAVTGGWPALCTFMCETAVPSQPAWTWPEARSYFHDALRTRLSHDERAFLRNAAMLESISSESYDYVFKTSSSAGLISRIESVHGLLTRCDDHRELKIQPVLRAFLRDLFNEKEGHRRSYILKRVAFWHWRRREFAQAISAALEAHDHRWAHSLSKDVILDLALRQGEIEALRQWFEMTPRAEVRRLPALELGYAWTMYFCQNAGEAEMTLQNASPTREDGAEGDGDEGWREIVLAIGKATHDEMAESERLCRRWIAVSDHQNEVALGAALTCLAFIAASGRNFDELRRLAQRAGATNRAVRQRYASGWLATAEIQAALFQGDMINARAILAKARDNSDISASRSSFARGLLLAMEFQVLSESDPDEASEEMAKAALSFAFDYGVTDILSGVAEAYSMRMYRKGECLEAQAVLLKTRALARTRHLPRLRLLADLMLTQQALLNGDASTQLEFADFDQSALLPGQAKAIQARVMLLRSMGELQRRRHGLAERHAKSSMQLAASIQDARGKLSAQYCASAAMHAMGSGSAKRVLAEADQVARHFNLHATRRQTQDALARLDQAYKTFFQEESQPIEPPLGRHEEDGPRLNADVNASHSLSMKQIVVLQCLSRGMSNKEIAERLCVTEDAVKWHLRQIFRELHASNRTEAVVAAQSRGLV